MANADVFGKAIDKIRDEMAKSGTRYVQVVGSMLTDYLQAHRDCAERIMAKDKTIAGSLAAMRKEAQKNATGGVGIIDDQEGMRIVLEYFDIGAAQEDAQAAQTEQTQTPEPEPEPEHAAADEFDIDALLGGL